MYWTIAFIAIGAFLLGYVAGAIRIAKRLNRFIPIVEAFEPHHEESSIETLKRASEALQSQAATMRGVVK